MQRRSRGPNNDLHYAALDGSIEHSMALLSRGEIDIDQGGFEGSTALMIASFRGFAHLVNVLLNKGANVAMVNDDGYDALHLSAKEGHSGVIKLLVQAGADLEATSSNMQKFTPLHQAAKGGHSEVMSMLLEAGANPNSRADWGSTPLYLTATAGHLDGFKVLLRAGADPMLATTNPNTGDGFLPLEAAARSGHSEIVRELIRRFGIEGCGGACGGTTALELAACEPHLEIMDMLTGAGVADAGYALLSAAKNGNGGAVKLLLQKGEAGLDTWTYKTGPAKHHWCMPPNVPSLPPPRLCGSSSMLKRTRHRSFKP